MILALWSPNEKNVIKQKVSGRITCCTWSRTGGLFALGLFDGTLLVRVFEDVQKANSNAVSSIIGSKLTLRIQFDNRGNNVLIQN